MMKMFEGVWKESPDREKEHRFPFVPWEDHHVQSILVIQQGALGDFILALPALETLRKTFPEAKSIIIGYPRILELVEQRFYAERILSIDQRGMASFFVRGGPLDPSLNSLASSSNKYHYPWCEWALKIKAENLVKFESAKEALTAGYVPCKVCKPPTED
jgi:hypothetical protein